MTASPSITTIPAGSLSTSPLSAARILNGVIYSSGQVGRDPNTGEVPSDLEGQVRLAIANLGRVLEEAGGSLDAVLKTTVFLTRREDFQAMNAIYGALMSGDLPARSTVVVAALADSRFLFEIEAIGAQVPG